MTSKMNAPCIFDDSLSPISLHVQSEVTYIMEVDSRNWMR